MKKFLFLICFLMQFAFLQAQEVIIGTGTSTSSSVAFYPLYMDSWFESTYQASEINAPGAILSLSLQTNSSSTLSCATVDIYMGHRSSSEYSSTTNWTPMSDLTLVYSGTNENIGNAVAGWETFNLQIPFVYNGTDNLVIVWAKHATNWTSSLSYLYTGTTGYTNLYRNADNSPAYAQHPGSATGSRGTSRPNIKLTMGNVNCLPPTGLQQSNLSSDQCDFSWSNEDGDVFNYQYKADDESWDDAYTDVTTDNSVSLIGLDPNTTYNFRIQKDCGDTVSIWVNKTFTTTQVPAILPYNHDFTDDDENNQWVLLSSGVNHWYIGNATSFDDDGFDKSMYISNDSIGTYAATSETSYMYAERMIDFGENPSSFTISADWKASGYVSSSSIYSAVLMYIREADEATPEGGFPSYVNNYLQYSVLDTTWTHVTVQIDSVSGVKKLQFFTWGYSNEDARNVPAAIDNITIEETECVTPEFDFETTDVTATLTHNGSDDGTYLLIYRVRGNSASTNVYVNFTGSTYEITGLEPNTTYYAWLAQICGSDTSVTNFAHTFTTQCGIFNAPYADDFTNEPTCWFLDNEDNEFLYSTSGYLYAYGSDTAWAVSPVINASTLSSPYLKFSHYQTTGSGLHIFYRTDNEADWTYLVSYTTSGSNFTADSLPIPSNSSTLQIGFMADCAEGGYTYIDNVSVYDGPECPTVTAINIDNVLAEEVTISWADISETGYEVRYKAASDDDWTELDPITTNSITIEQLTPLTNYIVEIATSCSELTYVAVDFTTLMIAVDLPYETDFSDDADRNWLIDNYTATNKWFMGTPTNYSNYSSLYISADSTNATYDNSSAGTVVASKIFNAGSSASINVAFDAMIGGESYWDFIKVFVAPASVDYSVNTTYPSYSTCTTTSSDAVAYAMNFSSYLSQTGYTSSSYPNKLNLTQGNMIHVNEEIVNPDPDGLIQLVFVWRNDGSGGTTSPSAIITNVHVSAISCSAPTALALDNVSSDEISFHFVSASEDDIEWEAMLISPDDTAYVTLNDTSYTFDELTPDTHYSILVRNICGEDNYSLWSAPLSVRTTCATVVAPYAEDFTGFNTNPSPCWERFTGLASSAFAGGSLTSSTGGWYFNTSNVYPIGHPKVNIYGNSCNYWLVSPAIDLSQLTEPALNFQLALTDYGNVNPIEDPTDQVDDQFMVIISTDNGATWSAANAIIWNNNGTGDYVYNTISNTGEDIFISLSQYGDSTIRIAFYGESTSSNGDNDLHIANVVVDEMPACLHPTGLTASAITMTEATVDFTPASENDFAWEYALCSGNDDIETVTPEPISTTTFPLTNLTPATAYTLYVRTVCDEGGYSNWSSPLHFSTMICDSVDKCDYKFALHDSYGDGWNGNAIEVKQNGITIASATITNGYSDTVIVSLCQNMPTQLVYVSGSYPSECSFSLIGPDGSELTNVSNLSLYVAGDIIDTFTTNCSGCIIPTNLTATLSSDATSATITWNAGGSETNWVLEYQAAGSSWTSVTISGTPTYTISNLTAATIYTVRVQADCGDGMSGYKTTSFNTPICDISNQCEYIFICTDGFGDGWNGGHLTIQQNGINVATVEAINHGLEDEQSTDTIRVMLCDNLSTSFIWSVGLYDDEVGITIIDPSGTVLYSEPDMSEITSYTLLTFTSNCGGVTPPSNPTVTTDATSGITQTSATLNATITNTDNVTITAKGFEWKATTGGTYTQIAGTGTGNSFTANLTSLTANTGYTVKAFITFNGTTVYGSEVTFTTLPEDVDPCNAPTGLAVNNITTNSATATWNAGGTETSWNVQYKLQSASQWQEATVNTTTYEFEGLSAASTYDVRVKAICSADNQSDFVSTTFTTQTVGIDNITLANNINLMPNPADNYIDLTVNSNVAVKEAVVYNAFGQLIQTIELNDNHARIDLSDMAAGMYFVRVNGDNVSATKKFIKR